MNITPDQFARAAGISLARATPWYPHITTSMGRWGINTPARAAHFIGQIVVESGSFTCVEENLDYSAARLMTVWPYRFRTMEIAQRYAHNPELLAKYVYAARMGNTLPSDAYDYRGRGLKQLTGKDNYTAYMLDSGVDALVHPDLLLEPEYAADSAGWFWHSKNCSSFADVGDVAGLTRRINGGTTGLAERMAATKRAQKVLCA
jgi:putative chitinase